ncbi:helix-turn-helix transcriptional regulator [uncultured Rhodospira sp.]|uniref:helix-turn-helix transcriptional regulator n=1 Tax=uncultured Rhodospira sp. TaxID=1936189 RepID=UPI0026054CEF|nr:helix-turn-helix transcriptional regulator [uncultured Rhodospira sp.]
MIENETITLSRAEYDAMQQRIADLEDMALIAERRNEPTISHQNVKRILAGESPVTIWREEKGLKQYELARAAGMSASVLNEIEKGKKTPSLTTAKAIAAALDVSLDDLFS